MTLEKIRPGATTATTANSTDTTLFTSNMLRALLFFLGAVFVTLALFLVNTGSSRAVLTVVFSLMGSGFFSTGALLSILHKDPVKS